MKTFSVLVFLLSFSGFATSTCDHNSNSFNCVKFLKNYDGDTISVNIDGQHHLFGKNISVRIRGIDTPEIKGASECEKKSARNAKKLVFNLLKNAKRVDLKNVSRGKYFRVVADVVFDGKNLSEILVKNKLAVFYGGGKKQLVDWCSRK